MKSFYSDACTYNQHTLCNDQECQCGCHFIARNGGKSPEEFKMRLKKVAELEESQ